MGGVIKLNLYLFFQFIFNINMDCNKINLQPQILHNIILLIHIYIVKVLRHYFASILRISNNLLSIYNRIAKDTCIKNIIIANIEIDTLFQLNML